MESNFDWSTQSIHFCVKRKYFTWFLDLCLHKTGKLIHEMFYSDMCIFFLQKKKYSSSFKTHKRLKKKINQRNIGALMNTLTDYSDPGTSQSKTSHIKSLFFT